MRDLDLRVMRGDRLGVIGPNGAGKSTLLKLILGELAPDAGTVRLGTKLESRTSTSCARSSTSPQTLAETISPGSEWIESAGQRQHVLTYLGDFLFPPQRAQAPVTTLSGGERNRLLLARLFAKPANLLVLDEPTNDLDIESLELLEETLQAYPGTLLLVSHDRAFLDNVVTQTLVAEATASGASTSGGYSDWLVQRPAPVERGAAEAATQVARADSRRERTPSPGSPSRSSASSTHCPPRSRRSKREQHALTERMCAPGTTSRRRKCIRADRQRAESIEHALAEKFERWAALDAKAAAKPSR